MNSTLEAHTADGRLVISFPEEALPSAERESFVSYLKTEWTARQSRLSAGDAERLAEEVDGGWWQRNRDRILTRIVEEGK